MVTFFTTFKQFFVFLPERFDLKAGFQRKNSMNEIIEAVNRAAENAEAKAAVAADAGALEALRIEYLGRNGLFPE